MMNDSLFPFRKTDHLHDYACFHINTETWEKTWLFCESMNQYEQGEKIPDTSGKGYYIIDFEL